MDFGVKRNSGGESSELSPIPTNHKTPPALGGVCYLVATTRLELVTKGL